MNGQKTVDEYIAAFDDWRTDAMKRLREVVKEGAPHSAVGIKWAQPVWEWNGPMIWMKAYPKHVDIGFWRGTEMEDQLPALPGLRPEFVTLMIGVNDVVQGVPDAIYRANIDLILDRILGSVPSGRGLGLATPDYTVSPQGAAFGSPSQQAGIERVNAILRDGCEERGA